MDPIYTTVSELPNLLKPGTTAYVASPFTHPKAMVREWRFRSVAEATLYWNLKLIAAISPIVHSHVLVQLSGDESIGEDWGTWKPVDMPLVKAFDVFIVLMLPGWDESVGVQEELQYALSIGKQVYFVDYSGDSHE